MNRIIIGLALLLAMPAFAQMGSQTGQFGSVGSGSSASAAVATNGPDGSLISPPTLGYFGLSFRYGFQTFDQPFPVYSMDLRHWAFASRPLSFYPYSSFRDAAIIKYNKQYVLSCTTNVFTTFSESGVPIFVSTNLNDWSLVTNLNFFVAGEVNDTCWAPKFLDYGTNLWIFATCSTNGNISHFIRGMYCPSNNFPFGFTGLFMVTQSETNMIDLSPWYEPSSGKSGAWFKNETTKYVELGEWSNSTPTSIFTNVLTGNFAGFGGNQEAPFMEFIPGGYALLMDDYGGQTINGNANDPGYYQISYSTNIESPSAWSYPSNVDFGGYHFASFVPVNLTTANDQFYAIQRMVSSMSGSPQHMIISSITNGYRLYGFSGSSDMAGFNLGNEFYSAGGIYGDGNGATHIYTSTGYASKTTPFQGPNTLDAIIISGGNSVAIAPGLTLSGNASGLTNIPPTSLSAGTTFNNVDIPTNALGTHGYSGYFTNGVFVSTGTY